MPSPGGVRFTVRLTPRGGRDAIDGVDLSGQLIVRVAAAPVDGAANRALLRVLAGDLGIAAGRIRIVAGASARRKIVEIAGLTAADVGERYPGLAV